MPLHDRLVNLDLAGGALLDLGVYSLTWLFQILYQCQPDTASDPGAREPPVVTSVMHRYPATGADESTTVLLTFPRHRTTGIALTSLRFGTDPDGASAGGVAVRIQGSAGEIELMGPACKPQRYRVVRKSDPGKVEVVDCPIPKDKTTGVGHGMFWEADEAARCLRDGKKESESLPWSESILVMEVMEKVLNDGGVKYPDLITSAVYERDGKLNTGKA